MHPPSADVPAGREHTGANGFKEIRLAVVQRPEEMPPSQPAAPSSAEHEAAVVDPPGFRRQPRCVRGIPPPIITNTAPRGR